MVKSELIQELAQRANISKTDAEALVNLLFSSMVQELVENKPIEIRGFGSFRMRSYEGYKARNPRTGRNVMVESKRLPYFRSGKELRIRLNK
jgi:integration host factor subunit beta